jgi:lipopolysaccharide transport system ATP-binding protein
VRKSYPLYHHITGGFKNFLLNLPEALKSFRQKRFTALQDISFEINRGETVGIIGRNGAGKSTLLGLMAGVLKPSRGTIAINGRVAPLLELGGGFHPELTGKENIILNGILLGMTRKEVVRKIDDIIEFSGLAEFIEQPIRTYSSGMLARLGFSVITHLDPEILLIDEILAVGDLDFQKKCISRMLDFKKRGVTMVFVSHAMEDVPMICDRVLWIENHGIKREGTPGDVISEYISPQGDSGEIGGNPQAKGV